jgi:hypothetical protein
MTQVKLRKALQVKNRLAGEVANLTKLIQANNSTVEGTSKFNIAALFDERAATVEKLTKVKTAIAVANVPIYEKIDTLAEIKSHIAMLRSLNTAEGVQSHGYGENTKTYTIVAFVNAAEVEVMVKRLNLDIEKLQDEIDYFNTVTEITIPD